MNPTIQQFLNTVKVAVPAMSETDLADLAKVLTVSEYKAKENYLSAGERQTHAGYITQGLARIYYVSDKGDERTMNFFAEGQFLFDFLAFRENKSSSFTIQCLENTIAVDIPTDYIAQLLDRQSPFVFFFYQEMEKKFLDFIRRTESLLFESAEARYLHFMQQKPSLLPRIPITHLCSYLGMERQTLTRIRKKIATSAF